MYNKPYRFVIVSPRQHKGGSIVLHSLCKQLDNMGYDYDEDYFICFNKEKLTYQETKVKWDEKRQDFPALTVSLVQ